MSTAAETAAKIASALTEQGYHARVWEGRGALRVYVSRDLSRRRQEIGYVGLDDETGEVTAYDIARARSSIERIVTAAVEG